MWCSLLFDQKPSHHTLAGIRKSGFVAPVSWLWWAAPVAAEHAGSRWGRGARTAPWWPLGLGLLLTPGASHLGVCNSINQSVTGSSQLIFQGAKLLLMIAHTAVTLPALPKADLHLAEVLRCLSVTWMWSLWSAQCQVLCITLYCCSVKHPVSLSAVTPKYPSQATSLHHADSHKEAIPGVYQLESPISVHKHCFLLHRSSQIFRRRSALWIGVF